MDDLVAVNDGVGGASPAGPTMGEVNVLLNGAGGGKPCPADVDGSGEVAFGDLILLLASWGPCVGCPADIDGNDEVAFGDLILLLASWGPCG